MGEGGLPPAPAEEDDNDNDNDDDDDGDDSTRPSLPSFPDCSTPLTTPPVPAECSAVSKAAATASQESPTPAARSLNIDSAPCTSAS